MSTENPARQTALAQRVVAEGHSQVPSFDSMHRLASSIVKSGLFGIKDVDQAIALMAIAAGEGKPIALIARDFDIIQGRAAKKSEAMLRDFIASGGSVKWKDLSDTAAEAQFSHPQGGSVTIRWDMERAKNAGLSGKEMYKKYPRQMLRSRVVSEGCRTVCPSATSGMYTPEEGRDIAEERDVTPVSQAEAVRQAVAAANPLSEEERQQHFDAMDNAKTQPELATAFAAAWKHASEAKDIGCRDAFRVVYDGRKSEIAAEKSEEAPT